MLRINRLRIEINTINGVYGFAETFKSGLNFVSSIDNTCGKSSILAAIIALDLSKYWAACLVLVAKS